MSFVRSCLDLSTGLGTAAEPCTPSQACVAGWICLEFSPAFPMR